MSDDSVFPSDAADKYVIRFSSKEMRAQLKELAVKSGRKTLAAEINAALQAHIDSKGGLAGQCISRDEAISAKIDISETVQKNMSDLIAARIFDLQNRSKIDMPVATLAMVYVDDGDYKIRYFRGIDARSWDLAVKRALGELVKIYKDGGNIVSAILSSHCSSPTDPTISKVFQPKDWMI